MSGSFGKSIDGLTRALRRLAGRAELGPRGSAPLVHTPDSYVPAGHYYSPLPSFADIEAAQRAGDAPEQLAGVDLDEAGQLRLLEELAQYYPAMPFTEGPAPGLRYRFDNPAYSYADGVLLHAMLRHLKPRRVIEVGSGYSSALLLDTNERFLDGGVEFVFIEPHPELLNSLLTDADRRRTQVLPVRLQDVPLSQFESLGTGDILFVDSTHVSKVNSDVNRLFFEILPRLAPGVMVHLHDIFPSFEYPREWLLQGRAWNEQYLLRAFLEFNAAFRVRLFASDMIRRHPAWFRARMPLCLKNPGGAFWMEKVM